MSKDSLKAQLTQLGAEYLAERLIDFSNCDAKIAKELKLLVIKDNPKKLATKIRQQINAIKRCNRFVTWNQAQALANELYQLTNTIEKDLLPRDPELSIELIELLFAIDKSLFERTDDSNGDLGSFYYFLTQLWGKAWLAFEKRDIEALAQKICDLLIADDYGARGHLIEYSSQALGSEGLKLLEEIIVTNKSHFSPHTLDWIHIAIADAAGDVEQYIASIKKYSVINELTVCDIAERLIKKWRGIEAIDWLLHQPSDISLKEKPQLFDPKKVISSKRYDLLLLAYDSETMLEEAQSLRMRMGNYTLIAFTI